MTAAIATAARLRRPARCSKRIWNGFLDLTAQLVMPDWGALIALLPIAIMVVVLVWLVWMIRRLPGPAQGASRQEPVAPQDAGRHPHARAVVRAVFAAIGAVRCCSSGSSSAARSCSSASSRWP